MENWKWDFLKERVPEIAWTGYRTYFLSEPEADFLKGKIQWMSRSLLC